MFCPRDKPHHTPLKTANSKCLTSLGKTASGARITERKYRHLLLGNQDEPENAPTTEIPLKSSESAPAPKLAMQRAAYLRRGAPALAKRYANDGPSEILKLSHAALVGVRRACAPMRNLASEIVAVNATICTCRVH